MLKITLAQLNPTVGALQHNLEKMLTAAVHAIKDTADLIVFPELMITGYPPEDLLYREDFIVNALAAVKNYAKKTPSISSVVGLPYRHNGKLYNAAAVTQAGKLQHIYFKQNLPNYGVFDEKRYFSKGSQPLTFTIKGQVIGLSICEDCWQPETIGKYKEQIDCLVSINASPFELNKKQSRLNLLKKLINECHFPIIYVNQVGGQDDLIFDGGSLLLNNQGELIQQLPPFEEIVKTVQLNQALPPSQTDNDNDNEHVLQALTLATKDYIVKNKFKGAIIGLSGGIDSALTLAIAVRAIGAANVTAVMMPSQYTSTMSLEDAKQLATNLSVDYQIIPIDRCVQEFTSALHTHFEGLAADATEENIQARIRGTLLMALSNKSGNIVLTTGNRSELAVGYATLYGDMAGGFAVLKDIYKTKVFDICKHINQTKPSIPVRIIERPPSAELAHDQKDEDNLPPYSILDQILHLYLDQEWPAQRIIKHGFDQIIVKKVIMLVDRNEYKRRQSPPGARINHRAFGRDRRYPMTNSYKAL